MKKLIITFMIILVAWGWTIPLRAQTNDLSPEELEMFREEVKHRVNRFQMYLTFIASKKNDNATKRAYIKQALRLFIGEGEIYEDIDGNKQPAVRVQLSNTKYRNRRHWIRTKSYLNNLIRVTYKELKITWADVCRVGEFYKVKDGLYVTTVTISQRYEGIWDTGSIVNYDDKSITVYLQEEVTSVGGRYRILFGDIEILQTD